MLATQRNITYLALLCVLLTFITPILGNAVSITLPTATTAAAATKTVATGPITYTATVTQTIGSNYNLVFIPAVSAPALAWVIAHYVIAGGAQQNVGLQVNGQGQYTLAAPMQIPANQQMTYSFTYQIQGGVAYDTSSSQYVGQPIPAGYGSGGDAITYYTGVQQAGSPNQYQFTFTVMDNPSNVVLDWVILHYTVKDSTGTVIRAFNYGMSSQYGVNWFSGVPQLAAGQTLSYSFTYHDKSLNVAYDTPAATWAATQQ